MSRSYTQSELAMDSVRGAGVFMGVIALILVALAGFASGYSRISPPQPQRSAQLEIGLERASLMDPSELAPVAVEPAPKQVVSIETPAIQVEPAPLTLPAIAAVAAEVAPETLQVSAGPV